MNYDVIIMGAGPGGYLAAERAGHAGLKTLLIEKNKVGGVCLNEGCVPSKTLLNSAKIYEYTQKGKKFGVICDGVEYAQDKVIKRKDSVVKKLVKGVEASLTKNKVTLVHGVAIVKGIKDSNYIVGVDGEEYTGKNLIIATGSHAFIPPIPGVNDAVEAGIAITNKEILDLQSIPDKLVVIGGGVIGLEMACYYAAVGSQVTVIEMLDHIGGPTDKQVGNILKGNLEQKGIKFMLGAKVTGIDKNKVIYEVSGKENHVYGDKILLSIGRRPNTENLGFENLALAIEKGSITVDEKCATNVPGVYAIGDVNGKSMLAHTAYREGEVAVNNILGKKDIMRYNAIPSVIYTNPEVASVGETEETASKKGIPYTVKNISMNYSGRYMAENDNGDGITKVLIHGKYNNIIGIQIIGSYASEIIYGGSIMVENEMLIRDLKEVVFPHPTVSEIIREAIFTD